MHGIITTSSDSARLIKETKDNSDVFQTPREEELSGTVVSQGSHIRKLAGGFQPFRYALHGSVTLPWFLAAATPFFLMMNDEGIPIHWRRCDYRDPCRSLF